MLRSAGPRRPQDRTTAVSRRGARIACAAVACAVLAATAQASGVRPRRPAQLRITRAHLASLLSTGARAAARDNVNFAEILGIAAPGAGETLRIHSAWNTPRRIEASAIDFSSGLLRSDAKAVQSISVQTLVRGDTAYIRPATSTGRWTREHVTPTSVSTAQLAGHLLSLAPTNGVVRTSAGRAGSAYRLSLHTTELGLLTAFSSQLPTGALRAFTATDRRLLAGLKITIPDLSLTLDSHDRLTSLKASGIVTETRADATASGEPYPRGGVSGVLLLRLAYRYGGRLTVTAPPASQILTASRRGARRRSTTAVSHASGSCSDSWTGGAGTADWMTAGNWSAGVPDASSDVCITQAGTYTVTLGVDGGQGGPVTVNSLTVGGASGTQTLEVHGVNGTGDTQLTSNSITNSANGAILIDCVATAGGSAPCSGGQVSVTVPAPGTWVNAGTITATAANDVQLQGDMTNTGTITATAANDVQLQGDMTNTGTLAIAAPSVTYGESTSNTPVTLDNQGAITLANAAELLTSQTVTNDTGGSVQAAGTGTLHSTGTFNEEAGTTSGSVPVTLANGATLDTTGSGAGSFEMYEGGSYTLSGTLASSQSLNIAGVNGTGDTDVTATPGFTNHGSILLSCASSPGASSACSGGYVTLGVSSGTLFNDGTLTTTAANNVQLLGNITNTGTVAIQDPTAVFGEFTNGTPVTLENQGTVTLANAAELSTSQTVTDDTGGSIQATGSGTLEDSGAFNAGAGTTSGPVPVTLSGNAALNLTGAGAGSFEMYEGGSYTLTGTLAASQSLIIDGVNGTGDTHVTAAPGFTSHGDITLACVASPGGSSPCSGGYVTLGASSGALVNDGTLTATAANATQLTGNVINAGTLGIGTQSLPSTLEVTGDYTQTVAGVLAIPVGGTSAGDFSVLQVDGNSSLAGVLSLEPTDPYTTSAAVGDSADVLNYRGTLTGTFAATTVSPQSSTPPAITGTPVLGDRLSCSTGTFSDSPASYAYQWNRDGAAISGATANTYTVVSADVGQSLSCTVTASSGAPLADGDGFGVSYSVAQQVDAVVTNTYTPGTGSGTSAPISVSAPPANVAAPAITGTAKVGDVLTCSQGTWLYGPTNFAYAWYRNGAAITGATGASYDVSAADAGQPLDCAVTASNAAGSATSTSGMVDVAVPLTLTPGTLPSAVGANPYSEALTACGGALPACEHYSTSSQSLVDPSGATVTAASAATFSVGAGTLPPGISLSSAGLLSGAPTQSGSFPLTLSVTDPAGVTASVATTLTVSPGVFIQQTDGTFSLGGAIPTGSVTVSPSGSGAIASVVMSSGGNADVPVAGASGAEDALGLQLSGSGSACTTSLKIAGTSGVALSTSGISTSGCAASATSARLARKLSTAPARTPPARTPPARTARTTSPRTTSLRTTSPRTATHGLETASARSTRSSALTSGTVTVQSVAANGVAGSVLGTGTVNASGSFTLTILGTGATADGPTRVTVSGGSYTSELDGASGESLTALTSLVDSTGPLPALLPVVALTPIIGSSPVAPTSGTVLTTPHTSANATAMSAYGFTTGTTVEQVVPDFTAAAGGNAVTAASILADLEAEAASDATTDRGALVSALSEEIADGVVGGSPVPLGSTSLPRAASSSAFLTGLPVFATSQSSTVPPLAPEASTIVQALPVAVTPVIPAAVTRIGPEAFTETLTAASPTTARSPFSTGSDSFDIEVVG